MPSPARLLMAGALCRRDDSLVAASIDAAPSPGRHGDDGGRGRLPVVAGSHRRRWLRHRPRVDTNSRTTSAVIYARTDVGGAYRWEDESGRWRQLFNASAMQVDDLGPSDYSVASIAVAPSDGDVVYAAVGYDFDPEDPGDELSRGGRLLRSVDGGSTWTASSQRFFVSGNQRFRVGTERLAVDPLDPRHVVFGSQREGLWRSIGRRRDVDADPRRSPARRHRRRRRRPAGGGQLHALRRHRRTVAPVRRRRPSRRVRLRRRRRVVAAGHRPERGRGPGRAGARRTSVDLLRQHTRRRCGTSRRGRPRLPDRQRHGDPRPGHVVAGRRRPDRSPAPRARRRGDARRAAVDVA